MSDGFSLAAYGSIVEALRNDGYEFRTFTTVDPAARHVVMRHDIDMDIETALPMAELEAELGVPGIYFVLTQSELYSPFSARNRRALLQVLAAGHEVGLHFDVSLYPEATTDELDDLCAQECGALEAVIDRPVTMVSFHRPAPGLIGLDRPIGGRAHAYQPRYFADLAYRSDSRGRWNPLSPLERTAGEPAAMQVLTHPIWWTGPPEESVVQRLERLLADKRELLHAELAANCRPYAEHVGLADKGRTEPFSSR